MARRQVSKNTVSDLKKQPKRVNYFLESLGVKPYEVKRNEAYMNQDQLHHFEMILTLWREKLWRDSGHTLDELKTDSIIESDLADGASQEAAFEMEFIMREREQKLLQKIEQALTRIQKGRFGYCLETGEPIGLERLEIRPIAEYSVDAQVLQERDKSMQSQSAWLNRDRGEEE